MSKAETNTMFAEASLQSLVMTDMNGLLVPTRKNAIGEAFSADFISLTYTMGLGEIPFYPLLDLDRDSTGVAIGGGATQSFGEDVPRILNGRLYVDGGGSNVVLQPTDFSNAAWTKTNVAAPVAADGPAGPGTAWSMAETAATGAHSVGQSVTNLPAFIRMTCHMLVKVTGRDYLEFDLFNGATTAGVRTRFSLLGGGSILSPYPSGLGTGNSDLAAGIVDYGGGYWLIWQTVTLAASSTGMRPTLKLMSDATATSYAGDPSKGFTVAACWGIIGSNTPVNFLTGTRAPESFRVPLGQAYYATQIVDGRGENNGILAVTDLGQIWKPAPRTGGFWMTSATAYFLNAYDTVTRPDTSPGSLGIATDGGSYQVLKNPGSYPMVPATNGFVLNNAFQFTPTTAPNGAVYAVRTVGNGVVTRYLSAEVAWDADTGTASNTAFALLTSNDLPNLTARMPVHCVIGRGSVNMQFRTPADGFVTLGNIKPVLGAIPKDGSWNSIVVAIQGNRAKVTWAGVSIVVQHDIFLELTRYACFELFADQPVGSNTDRAKGRNLIASVAEVGAPLSYTAAAPVNIALPFASGTPVAGNTYSAQSTQGGWTSNNGGLVYTYQWQFDGVDIPGATNATLVTATPADVGKRVSVRVIATNTSGSTSATSPQSAPLA